MNERTRLYVAMGLAAVILFGWQPLVQGIEGLTGWKLWPDVPVATTRPTTEPATTAPAVGTSPAFASTATRPAGSVAVAPPATRPADVMIGSAIKKDKTFAMSLRVTPTGGGLGDVALNDFDARVKSNELFSFGPPADPNEPILSTRSVTIDGAKQEVAGGVWRIDSRTDRSATLALDLNDLQGVPLLTLLKTFEVMERGDGGGKGPLGYESKFTYAFVNRTGRPMTVSSELIGPTFPPSEHAVGGDRQVIGGYQGKNVVVLKHDALESFSGNTPKDYSTYENQPLLWFGTGGSYFNALVRPTGAQWIKSASAAAVNTDGELPRKVVLQMATNDIALAAGETKALDARVFFGPRKREFLKNPYYTAPGVGYGHTLEITGSCAFCTFQWLVDFLMLLLGFFQTVLQDWGLAIIALVFVVRACLHPITKRAQINMAKMGKMGPEIQRIKDKYGDDKDGLNRAMMEFYKSQGATPILGCLPMFLQMPIWIALYSGLSSTFELRQAPFLEFFGRNLTWIHDLSKPDHLIQFAQPYNFFFLHLDGLNIIPFLLAIAFFLQQKFTPKPVATTPEQEQQQKMMQWMTLLFPVFLYSSPSGLNLYILTSTIFGIIEAKIIRKHIAERDALEAAGPVFVDGDVVDRKPAKKAESKKAGGIWGKFAELQERVEQMRNEAEKKARDKRK